MAPAGGPLVTFGSSRPVANQPFFRKPLLDLKG